MYIKLFILFQNGLFGLFGTKNMGIDTKMKSLRVLQVELWPYSFFAEKWRHYEIIAKDDKILKEQWKSFIFRHLAIRKVSKISTNPIHVGLANCVTDKNIKNHGGHFESWRQQTSICQNTFLLVFFYINRNPRCF